MKLFRNDWLYILSAHPYNKSVCPARGTYPVSPYFEITNMKERKHYHGKAALGIGKEGAEELPEERIKKGEDRNA